MLEYLQYWDDVFGPLRLFRYITFRAAMAAATAMLIGFILAPRIIRRLQAFKFAQSFRDQAEVGRLAELHSGKKGTPTMGGVIIFLSVSLSVLLWAQLNIYVWVSLYVYTALTLLGFADDYRKIRYKNSKGVSGRSKMGIQVLVSASALSMLLLNGESQLLIRELWVPFVKDPFLSFTPLWILFPFFFLVISGSSNAINLTDGIDGLAVGCTVTVALAYGIMSYAAGNSVIADYLFIRFIPGVGELAVVCSALVAGSLVFLWFNAHPAMVFMGDTGSLAIGGLIGAIAFMILHPFTLVLVGGVFVAEALSVIIQVGSFKSRGKRVFRMAPIHHHFELKEWAETQVVIRFWILSLICSIAGLITLKLR